MIPAARLRPGRGFQPGRAALYYSQRMVTGPRLRRTIASVLALGVRMRQRDGEREADGAPAAFPPEVAALLDRDGIAMLPPLLGGDDLAAMTAFLLAQDVLGPELRPMALAALPSGTRGASYPLGTILECPGVLGLVARPEVLALARDYLGCAPTLSSIGIHWALPTAERESDTQRFHRDPDDWRFFKLFLYLTDVDEESGPHVTIAGTHRTAGQWRARPFGMEEIERRYGPGRARVITGPRGTGFVADTYGIHKGTVPTARPRLILQAQYSVLPVYAFDYRPVALEGGAAANRYLLRLLAA